MNEKPVNILFVSIYRDLIDDIMESGTPGKSVELKIGNNHILMDSFIGDPTQDSSFGAQVSKAQAVVMLVRFLDVLSLEKIKGIYRQLAQISPALPKAIFYLRDKGELDFKISCPSCGQKLWLRDTDVGKRGRCPNCSKSFVITSQSDHLKAQLLLPEGMPCVKVIRKDNDSFRSAVSKVADVVTLDITPSDKSINYEALKQSTVRIQIQDS
jgi:hypothetical protein